MTTKVEQAREKIAALEAQRGDLRLRFNAALHERNEKKAALLRGDIAAGDAHLSDYDALITGLEAMLAEKNEVGDPIGLAAEVEKARQALRDLGNERQALTARCERLRAQVSAGLGDKARAAIGAASVCSDYLTAAGHEGAALRAAIAIPTYAHRTLEELAALPALEARLAVIGE